MKFPNFDSVDAWPTLIKRGGPPNFYNTAFWEPLHYHLRKLKDAGTCNSHTHTFLKI